MGMEDEICCQVKKIEGAAGYDGNFPALDSGLGDCKPSV
jgi:hypothetical protein